VPAVTKLANLLARRGLPLGGAVFSQEELENAVTRALRGEKRK
jgi:hypothetical protein